MPTCPNGGSFSAILRQFFLQYTKYCRVKSALSGEKIPRRWSRCPFFKQGLIRCTMGMLLCFAMLSSTALADTGDIPSPFPDVPSNASYAEAVRTLYEMGIFAGDENGNFNPDKTITRAEVAKVICLLVGVGDEALAMKNQVFSDVPSSHWAAGYVAKASELGIVNGIGNGQFGPSNPLTYEQIITMLVRAWGYDELADKSGGYPNGYISIADESGYTKGTSISVGKPATRSTVAVLIYNTLY